jgi:hypothetical protein
MSDALCQKKKVAKNGRCVFIGWIILTGASAIPSASHMGRISLSKSLTAAFQSP